MTMRILLSVVGMWAVTGCGGSGTGAVSNIPNCNASHGNIAAILKQSSKTLASGTYKLERADYVNRFEGVSVVTTQKYTDEGGGKVSNEFFNTCPEMGKLAKSVSSASYSNEIPDAVVVNAKGELEIPDSFSILSVTIILKGDKVTLETQVPRATSPQAEGVSKDIIRKTPGLKIVPVKDGLVLISKEHTENEIYLFYRRTGTAASQRPVPVPQPAPGKKFSKEECLIETKVNLGKYSPDMIRFSNDCSWLYVVKGEPAIDVSAVAYPTGGGTEVCTRFTTARVVLVISNNALNVLRSLQKLNPDLNMNVDAMNSGSKISHLKQVGESRMTIPVVQGADDPSNPSRSVVTVNGSISAAVNLDNELTCRHYKELLDYSSNKHKLIDLITKEFAIEIDGR